MLCTCILVMSRVGLRMQERPPLPNLLIVGTPKAGSTTLFDALAAHPQVCPASTKETGYFLPLLRGEPLAPLDTYRSYFRSYSGEPIVLEATPSYFYGGTTIASALEETCAPYVIVVLREPVSRLVSDWHRRRWWMGIPADMTLQEYVDACDRKNGDEPVAQSAPYNGVQLGHYADFLPQWQEICGDRLRVLFFDQLVSDQATLLTGIANWLGIDPFPARDDALYRNPRVSYRSTKVQAASLRLRQHIRPVSSRHPQLARALRGVYSAVNERAAGHQSPPAELLAVLRKRYSVSNQRLADQLAAAGVSPLPDWLPEPARH